ncbi:MAG: NUDIX hydrolase [Pseudomonadota bacterium]
MIETLYKGKFVKLSKNGTWEYAERVNSTGAGFILAVTPEKELVLVEQYRVPMQARTIELPAGIIGDEGNDGEAVEASAMRELEEETGFRAARAEILLTGPVAPGLSSEMLYLVRTYDLVRVSAGGGVDNENITVHVIPLAQIDVWLADKAREGLLVEPRIYTALYFLLREKS